MFLILRDWDRQWALALDPEAQPGSACALDAEVAVGVLSRLILDAGHRDGIRRALATGYPRGLRALPADVPSLRLELESRLRNREWMLFAGGPISALKGGGGRSVPRWEAQPGPETEELVPLFEPEAPERPAVEWDLAEVVVVAAEAEPAEAQPPADIESDWDVESVVVDGEEAVPEAAAPESPEPVGAWELESVAVAEEEVVPEAAGPEAEAREAEGGWDVVGVVVEGEEVLPEG